MMKMYMMLMMMISFMNILINLIPAHNKWFHPVILMIILLCLCLFCAINIELYSEFNWISYLLYLIIIGGLMIIFLYFTSFIGNMKMTIKWNYIIMMPIKFMLIFIFFFLIIFKMIKFFPWYYLNYELNSLIFQINNKIMTMYMYMYNKNFITIMSMIYLLIVLIFIMKICLNKKLTLRKIN